MKTIELSDKDYEALMALSKELQEQENDGQAFPYFWVPTSQKLEQDPNDEGDAIQIYDVGGCDVFTPEEWAEHHPDQYRQFVEETYNDAESFNTDDDGSVEYDHDFESDWVEYLRSNAFKHEIRIYSSNFEWKEEINPSLFKSDVKGFISGNAHHLGDNPKTYAHSVWRMPKMEQLIKILYRLNPQPKEAVNHEAARIVFKDGENENN